MDIEMFCQESETFVERLGCLHKNQNRLSEHCTATIGDNELFVCANDALAFCPESHHPRDLFECLLVHDSSLSASCHDQLFEEEVEENEHDDVVNVEPIQLTLPQKEQEPTTPHESIVDAKPVSLNTVEKLPVGEEAHVTEDVIIEDTPQFRAWKSIALYSFIAFCLISILAMCVRQRRKSAQRSTIQIANPEVSTRLI